MYNVTGDRDQVLQLMNNTIQKLEAESAEAGAAGIGIDADTDDLSVAADLRMGFMEAQAQGASAAGLGATDDEEKGWYVPRNRQVAVFQSLMDEYLEEHAPDAPKDGSGGGSAGAASLGDSSEGTASTAAVFYTGGADPGVGSAAATALMEQFDNLDPRWVSWVFVKAKGWLKGKHKFTAHTSPNDFQFQMKDEATIAIVGDWGGGNAAAQEVARQITQINPDHVIHLGDVYYSGTPKETQERFLTYWPRPKEPGMSLALNSNHEMYGGGYGYFDSTLPAFKQPASYFNLSNQNWQFIGLDTGYDEHDLHPPQADWLAAQLQNPNKRTILLSHHQLFSAYETTDASKLQAKMQPFLDAGKIYAWIWGHEHLCVAYQPYLGVKAVCLGNGCFPYNPPTSRPQVPVEWLNDRAQPGDPDYRGIHTFALLKVTPAQIEVKYIDQDGYVGHTQTWA
ncbi:MAG TPA: metallophosphoesterase [Pyrinomonadaceae bacterium]